MAQEDINIAFPAAIKAGSVNGAIISVTNTKGDFQFEQAWGERTLLSGEKREERLDDIVFLASATKLLTTMAALRCVEDGLLTLKGSLSDLMPEFASMRVLKGFSDEGEPILEPRKHEISLEMLLTHSSGLVYYFLDPKIGRWRQKYLEAGQNPDSKKEYPVEQLLCYPLSFQPGELWMYGTSLDWAGRVVERATGKTLMEFLQINILTELGIKDASFFPVTREDLRRRMVDLNPQDPEARGLALAGGMDPNANTKGDFGGHGMFMSVPDFVKVLRSILLNDGQLLKPATVDGMFEDHLSDQAKKGLWQTLEDVSGNGTFFRMGTPAGTKVGHGLGALLTLEDVDGMYAQGSFTWGGGMALVWFIDRKNDLCGVSAIQPPLAADMTVINNLKQTFRYDIYRKHEQWKRTHM